jgi:hypothetical protein
MEALDIPTYAAVRASASPKENATWEMLVNIAIYNMSDDQPSTSASGFSCETWTLE